MIHDINKKNTSTYYSACHECCGLCCIALCFFKMDGFPEDKCAGVACSHLQSDTMCDVHAALAVKGYRGCIGYDCFGAGQYVTQHLYHGTLSFEKPRQREELYAVFLLVYQLFQIRYFLEETLCISIVQQYHSQAIHLLCEAEEICAGSRKRLLQFDIDDYHTRVSTILKKASRQLTDYLNSLPITKPLLNKTWHHHDFRGCDLSMSLLIQTTFDTCLFAGTNVLGADTRDCQFLNCDLRDAVFLTQSQLNHAKGDHRTRLPAHLQYPPTWKA